MLLRFESGMPDELTFAAWHAEAEHTGSDAGALYAQLQSSAQVWCAYEGDRLVGIAWQSPRGLQAPIVLKEYRKREVASTICKLLRSSDSPQSSAPLLYA